jgi:4'-phosphopantetheinyl transferase
MRPQRPTIPVILTPNPLSPNEVHLWVVDLDPEASDASRRRAAVSPDERKRAANFRRPEDRDRFLVAHGALRLILAEYVPGDPIGFTLSADERGKPFLADRRISNDLQFNLSHSGGLALVAVASARQVGVDIEQIRPMPDLDGVANRVCSPAERAALSGLAASHRESAFFAMWTRKEALAKASGEGIQAIVRESVDEPDGRYTLVEVTDLPGYAACVAAEGEGWQLVRRT